MKKIISVSILMLLVMGLVTGCTKKEKEDKNEKPANTPITADDQIDNQIYEGLEFVNVGASDGVIKTIVINNTGVVYKGSKFSMKVMDKDGNTIVELTDEVKEPMKTGTTKTIETKVDKDLSNAAAIEYSILK